ncbi:hypothetical protein JOM56_015593 [Amanita muscaria]
MAGCNTGYLISGILSVIRRTSVLSVWGLRTYALYNGNKLISIWMIILGLICFVTDVHVAGNRCSGEALYPLRITDLKAANGWTESYFYFFLKQGDSHAQFERFVVYRDVCLYHVGTIHYHFRCRHQRVLFDLLDRVQEGRQL